MANRYFVGTGTWDASTTTNWSASSGGSTGASVPTSADDVFVDALGGSSPVITTSGTINCLSLNFTGAITPTFAGSATLNIYGSITRIAAMTWSKTGATNFQATSTGKTITSAGGIYLGNVTFGGIGGGWTFQDAFSTGTSNLLHTDGTLNTNGFSVTCSTFQCNSTTTRTLTLGASIITVSNSWDLDTTTNLTFNAGTSNIIQTGNTKFFNGGGLTYNNVSPTGTPNTITGSNTFNILTIAIGKTLKLTSGTTQTVTSLLCNGTTALPSTLQSVTAASAATIAFSAGRYFIRHTSIKDITVSGATAVTSIAGTNVSGNTGITFVTKFEVGRIKNDGSFNWYSAATGATAKVSG